MTKATTKNEDKRNGLSGLGRWITLKEANKFSCGKEGWWKIAGADGIKVEVTQYVASAPQDKPVFMYSSGSMYLGEWNEKMTKRHGFGIYCHNFPDEYYKGRIYVGNWIYSKRHGVGKSVWLENAPCWENNQFDDSAITQPTNTPPGVVGRPYTYTGVYRGGVRHDPAAIVSLKDGTTRKGRWGDGYPVGDWWKDHESVAYANHDTSNDEDPNDQGEQGTAKPVTGVKTARSDDETVAAAPPAKKSRTRKSAPAKVKKEPEAARGRTGKAAARAIAVPRHGSNKKQRKSDDSSNEHADAAVSNVSAAAAAEVGAVRIRESDAECIEAICEWLIGIIGYGPSRPEMTAYANTFFERGFHSPGFIRACYKAENLDFMKPPHRLWFLGNAGLENA